ncbi:MAG: hypothetical protein KIT43_15520 [Bauldia sp.]|nr:hypothetical protein [Bauldia sp.]MCW5718126.1 hypothetical protein [Bauldia sp.]
MLRARKPPNDELLRQVTAIAARLREQLGLTGAVRTDVPLDEEGLGLDSMGRLDLFTAVEQECGVTIPEKYWGPRRLRNLGELARVAVGRA